MEEWRPAPGIPDCEVSSLGRVRKYISGSLNGDGYPSISRGRRGAGKTPIHVLVAEAFIGPRPEGQVVRHRNDNKFDARLDNLLYGTKKENWEDAERNGIVVRFCPKRAAVLKANCHRGGVWWKGRKRNGLRGKADG